MSVLAFCDVSFLIIILLDVNDQRRKMARDF